MSGMIAYYSWDAPVDRDLLLKMRAAMSHRGEVSTWWVSGSVGLAAIDWRPLSMYMPETLQVESCWIAADARLDYRTDLARRLEAEPHVLENGSDARLIGMSYAQWGEACVNYLEGDYAFVLWDGKQQRLFGARSIGGLRPFVYHATPKRFLCASEPGQLLEDPAVSRELNPVWVAFWLTRGQGHFDGTVYRDIQMLTPGHLMIVDAGGVKIKPFWWPPAQPPVRSSRQEEYTEQFRALLSDAVRTRLHGKLRLYFDLSGGLDSSSLVSLASTLWEQEGKPYPLDCFHVASDGSLPYVQEVALKYPVTRVHTIPWHAHLSFDGAFDPAPCMALPCRPTLMLASLYREQWAYASKLGAQAHIRGDFGDELLGASLDYLWMLWKERHPGKVISEMRWWQHIADLSPKALLEQWIIQPSLQNLSLRRIVPQRASTLWLQPDVLQQSREREAQDEAYFRKLCPDPFARQLVQWMYFHTDYTIQADIALRMAGVETREPYTDLRLIMFLLATPPHYQVRPNQQKFLLREAMQGVLPETVRGRQGKGRAYQFYFQGFKKHREQLRQVVVQMPELLTPYINRAPLLDAIDQVALGGQANVPALSGTLALVLWTHRLPWANGCLPVDPDFAYKPHTP